MVGVCAPPIEPMHQGEEWLYVTGRGRRGHVPLAGYWGLHAAGRAHAGCEVYATGRRQWTVPPAKPAQ